MKPILFGAAQVEKVWDHPRADRLLKGNPRRSTQTFFSSSDGLLDAGIWCCEAGAWRIAFAAGKEEFFCILEGRVQLHDEQGGIHTVGPGEAAVIPAGFRGVFEVVEPVRKYFVVVDRKAE